MIFPKAGFYFAIMLRHASAVYEYHALSPIHHNLLRCTSEWCDAHKRHKKTGWLKHRSPK